MEHKEYNGWTNYETWLVNLWLGNDSVDFNDRARDLLEETDFDRDAAIVNLADEIRAWHEEATPETTGVFADLLNAGMRMVNWYEIAEHYFDDITVYSAGWNMPGYLPDSEPVCFLDADDALEYVKDAAKEEIEDESSEDAYTQRCEAIDEWKSDKNGEFGETFGNYHYFVSIV
jgi:hypothetical protein